MANEISSTVTLSISKGGTTTTSSTTKLTTQTGTSQFTNTQAIGFAAAEVVYFHPDVVADSTGIGIICFKNTDATNFVSLKQGTGGTLMAKLLAGESCQFRTAIAVNTDPDIWALADTASVNLQVTTYSN